MIFYRREVKWLKPPEKEPWKDLRVFIFLNHTSLFEPLFFSTLPFGFLWEAAGRSLVPGATKTLNRPIVGKFFKLLGTGMVPITRRRDGTWSHFLSRIHSNSMVVILPEGRMKRPSGFDSHGRAMSIRPGIVEVLQALGSGNMVIAHSGGLHHVQEPGQLFPKIFKTLKISYEQFEISEYIKQASKNGEIDLKKAVVSDLEYRLNNLCPK